MNVAEMYDLVKKIYEENEGTYSFIGLRFEDKVREVGDECEWSKHNPDRADDREFPEFGTEEYDELAELNGTSAWNMASYGYKSDFYPGYGSGKPTESDKKYSLVGLFGAYHCYVIAGNRLGTHDDPDPGEILIKDAKVIAKIF